MNAPIDSDRIKLVKANCDYKASGKTATNLARKPTTKAIHKSNCFMIVNQQGNEYLCERFIFSRKWATIPVGYIYRQFPMDPPAQTGA